MTTTPGMQQHIKDRMDAVIGKYKELHDEGADTPIRDLLCDLMHHCAANGIDFDHELSMGTDFFGDEQEGE